MLESARLAISFLGDELMMAGYLGCFGALGDRQINNNLMLLLLAFNLGLVCRVGNLQGLHLGRDSLSDYSEFGWNNFV
jgi:hypothetical protein